MGYVCNVSSSTCYIACPMLTIGEYDVDWKPNPLDSKSDIVGVGNLLSNSLNVPYGDNWTNAGYLCLSADDFCSYDISRYVSTTAAHAPVLDSGYPIVKSFIVKVSQNEPAGITQIYNNQGLIEYGKFPGHTALMDFISNSDREIPISMSIWCYAENAVKIALMPIRVSSCNIFAPVTYDDLPAGEWRRFTRTIYIPANEAKTFNNANIWMGGALATGTDSTEVKFALPMVTLGSTPSTWFPSAYDILNGIDSASSAASSAQQDATYALGVASNAQSLANNASSTATVANTTANTALTNANNKVSKSGDTMSGDLNMGGYVLNNVNELYTNYMFSNDEGYIQVSDPTYINEGFCDGSGKAYSSSQLMQGDGSPRTIITNLSNTTSIPTGSAVYNAIRYGNLNIYSVAGSTATSFTWAPDMYTTTYGSSNYQHLMGHTASTLAITINPNYTNTNFQYLLIYQSGNTCTITLTGNNIRTKGNITSFTVTAGQSIEFCALFVNGFTYVTYTIFG